MYIYLYVYIYVYAFIFIYPHRFIFCVYKHMIEGRRVVVVAAVVAVVMKTNTWCGGGGGGEGERLPPSLHDSAFLGVIHLPSDCLEEPIQ
jgi:hypothetical protein